MEICEPISNASNKGEATKENAEKEHKKTFIDLDPKTSKILSKKICRIIIETNEKKQKELDFF